MAVSQQSDRTKLGVAGQPSYKSL